MTKEAYNCCNCVYWRMSGSVMEDDTKHGPKEIFIGPCRFGPPPHWPIMSEYQFCGLWSDEFVPDNQGGTMDSDDYGILQPKE